RIELPLGQIELELAGSQNVRRCRYNRRLGTKQSLGGFHFYVSCRPDARRRRARQQDARRHKPCEQRSQSLPAEPAVVALARAGEVRRRHLREVLSAAIGAKDEIYG